MDATQAALHLVGRREHSLLALFELSHELSVSLDAYAIADLALLNLLGHFGTPRAALWILPEEAPRQPVLVRAHGLGEELGRAIGVGLAPQLAGDPDAEPATIELAEWARAVRAPGAALAVEHDLALLAPTRTHGRVAGMVALGTRPSGEPYAAIDRDHLAAAAGMVGVAIENTRLYHRTLESNRQLREANERLAELDRLKGEFLQSVNHELRTPLAVIQGYASCMVEAQGIDAGQRRALEVMIEECQKLAGMVQNMLDFSEATSGALALAIEPVELRPLLIACAEGRRPGVVEGLRELDLSLADALPPARCDARRLLQVLDALLDNAVKFTPHGTRIRLTADRASGDGGEWLRVAVEDNGPGIPPRHLAVLFEPFRQADGSTTRTRGGMGMGLALARQIVERMEGSLEVRSELGRGTSFAILLPAA
jgi:signal transduction histidine kinase